MKKLRIVVILSISFLMTSFMLYSVGISVINQPYFKSIDQELSITAESHRPLWSCSYPNSVSDIDISSDGRYIVIGTDLLSITDVYNYVRFYDNNSNLLWSNVVGNKGDDVNAVAMSYNGDYIAAVSDDRNIYLFNKSGTKLWNYSTLNTVYFVDIAGNGDYVVAGSDDSQVYLFSRTNSTPLNAYSLPDPVKSVSISYDGQYYVATTYNRLSFFNKSSPTPIWNSTVSGTLKALISGDGKYVSVSDSINYLYLFNSSGYCLWNRSFLDDTRHTISTDGEYIFVGCGYRGFLLSKNSSIPIWSYLFPFSSSVVTVDISSNGQYIAVGLSGGSDVPDVYVFNRTSPVPMWTALSGASAIGQGSACVVSISSDGMKVSAAGTVGDAINYYGVVYYFDLVYQPPEQTLDVGLLATLGILGSSADYSVTIIVVAAVCIGIVLFLVLDYLRFGILFKKKVHPLGPKKGFT